MATLFSQRKHLIHMKRFSISLINANLNLTDAPRPTTGKYKKSKMSVGEVPG